LRFAFVLCLSRLKRARAGLDPIQQGGIEGIHNALQRSLGAPIGVGAGLPQSHLAASAPMTSAAVLSSRILAIGSG
jgi:hypothetical protein